MTNAELIKALRVEPFEVGSFGLARIMNQAADLIESQAKQIAELEAQLPKEGEWVEANTRPRSAQFYCSACHRTCYDIQPTRDKAYTKRCRYHYCPNCGAKMDCADGERR